jgi:hypothetical protein
MIEVKEVCALCGGELDDHGVKVTLTFAAGLTNGDTHLVVPYTMKDWPLCWGCFTGPGCKVLRAALADEYIEAQIDKEHEACHVACARSRPRRRRFFTVLGGSRGEPEEWARCPVCFGPCEVERAA